MSSPYSVIKSEDKFVVTKDGRPVSLPYGGGQKKITEFDTEDDAKKYISILQTLKVSKWWKV